MKKRINLFALLCALGLAFVLAGCGAKTQAPTNPTQAPVTTTVAPKTTTEAPGTSTKAPVTTTQAPVTQPPQTTTVAPHEHVWGEGEVTTNPTCTEKGVRTFTCSCGETKTEDVPALGHNMTHHEAVDATCTEAGNVEYWSCDRCNKNFSDESGTTEVSDVTTAALDHDYAQVVSYDNIAQGKVETWKVCSRNAEHKELVSTVFTNEYDTLAHATGFNNNGSTTMDGSTYSIDPSTKTVTIKTLPSSMSPWFRFDFARNAETTYKYGYVVLKGDNDALSVGIKFDTLGQDGIANNKYDGTTGNKQYKKVGNGTIVVIWDFEAIGLNSKELAKVVIWAYGNGDATNVKLEIIASGMFNLNDGTEKVVEHYYKDHNQAATCTEAGYTEKKCACGAVIDHVDLPELGHDYQWVVDKDATYLEAGSKHEECTRCHEKRNENTVIDKLAPLTVAEANALIDAVEATASTTLPGDFAVTGYVLKGAYFSSSSKYTLYIVDDLANPTNPLQVYNCVLDTNVTVQVGSLINVEGKLYKFIKSGAVTNEMTNSTVKSSTVSETQAKFGTAEAPLTVTEAMTNCGLFILPSEDYAYVKGVVKQVVTTSKKNAINIAVSTEAGEFLNCYFGTFPTENFKVPQVGDEVVIKGKYCAYYETMELTSPEIISQPYTVTIDANGGTVTYNGQAVTSLSLPKGTPASSLSGLTVTPPEHYEFAKWQIKVGENYIDIPEGATVTADIEIKAVYTQVEAKYYVRINTEFYSANSATFTFPAEKQYRDATGEYMDLLNLTYESTAHYYLYGKIGEVPDFSALEALPAVYKLVGTMPTNAITAEPVMYEIYYDINEAALGIPLSKISVGFPGDETYYMIGLERGANKYAGLSIRCNTGMKKMFANPILLDIDDLDISLYSSVTISYGANFENTGRNVKWLINNKNYQVTQQWITTSYSNYTVDVLPAINPSSGINTVTEIGLYPCAIDESNNMFRIVLNNITITEKEYNRTVTYKDGDTVVDTFKVANNTVINAPANLVKDGFYFVGWYNEELTQPFDFTQQINADVVIAAKWEAAVQYKVVIQTEHYTVTNQVFTFPEEKQYRNATSEFATMLGLLYNEAGDYYYAMGRKGMTPDFTALNSLPTIYGLVGSYPEDVIGDDTTYTIKFNINEAALGYPLSKISVGYYNDGTTYNIGLYKDAQHTGFEIIIVGGAKVAYSQPLTITLDNLNPALYSEAKVNYFAYFGTVGRNIKWSINGKYNTSSHTSTSSVQTNGVANYFNALDIVPYAGVNTLTEIAVRPLAPSFPDTNNDFHIFIDSISIKEKTDNRMVTFRNGVEEFLYYKVANGSKISAPATNPIKDGYYFLGWYNEDGTEEFDFDNTTITQDTVITAKWEEAVMYKVQILTEYYEVTCGSQFTFPDVKQYRDATDEFKTLLGLSHNAEGNFYCAYGRKGTTPDFTALDTLPAIYGLVGSYPTDLIADETVTYTIKYNINETALGYPLSKIRVGWGNEGTTYNIGLFNLKDRTGFAVIVYGGLNRAFSTPLSIVFDNIDATLYSQVKVSGSAKFESAARNTKWYLDTEDYTINDSSLKMQWVTIGSYTNFNIDVLAIASTNNQTTLKKLDVRPATAESGNPFFLFIDNISIVENEDNRTVTFKDGETVLSTKKVANNTVISAPATNPTKDGFYFVGWYNEELTQPFDFTQQINADVVIAAKWEAAVQYKVTVKVAKYDFVKDSENKRVFNIGTVSYVDQTSQYAGLLGSDSNGILYGRTGDVASFTSLSALPSVYKLNTTLSQTTSTIANDGTTEYVLVYDIDEEALGVQLSQISLYDLINVDGYTFKTTPYITLNYESEELCGVKIYMKAGNKVEIRIAFDESINFNDYQSIMINAKVKESTAEEKANSSEARPCTIIYTDKGNTEYYTYSGNPWGRYWGNFVNGVATIETNLIEEALHTQAKADATLTNVETLKYVSIVSIPWYGMNNGGAGVEVITYLGGVNITMKN